MKNIDALPPMLKQYLGYKEQYPDCLIFIQVGDFYEVFFDDAPIVAKTLNLTLTSRDKKAENPIPMCGVPIAVIDNYIGRLVDKGFSVAIVSQEGASISGKAVKRKLERIITPGIKVFGNIADTEAVLTSVYFKASSQSFSNFSIVSSNVQSAMAFVKDSLDEKELVRELRKIKPGEIILPIEVNKRKIDKRCSFIKEIGHYLPEVKVKFRHYSLSSNREFNLIKGFSALGLESKSAIRLLLDYIDETTVDSSLNISTIVTNDEDEFVSIDPNTRRNLELVENIKDGTRDFTLYEILNNCITLGGEKLLKAWISNPLKNIEQIKKRQDIVLLFKSNLDLRNALKYKLKYVSDLERLATRLELSIFSPKDAEALRDSLEVLPDIFNLLSKHKSLHIISNVLDGLNISAEVIAKLKETLKNSPSSTFKEGEVIRDGVSKELDRVRDIKEKGHTWFTGLELSERERTQISSLKIKFNNVLGYFIEITKANLAKVPENYINKQNTVNNNRFITEELKQMEKEVLSAKTKGIELEVEIFRSLVSYLKKFTAEFRKAHQVLAIIDVLLSFAEISELEAWVTPLLEENKEILITEGKHPVLARVLKSNFVPNPVFMAKDKQHLILTGPNMGGKSTYLRQIALLVVMAQIGSDIPAKEARIGLVDKIFARIGASDDLMQGDSTFMVEMREASHIISTATENSLLLIDEIGRGTATTDGLAIAKAIFEWIIERVDCRTIFATHFHSLTSLSNNYANVDNISVSSIDTEDGIVFTHEINNDPASKSYGLEVANLAGLPKELLSRASQLLKDTEIQKLHELPLFSETAVEKFSIKTVYPKDYEKLKGLKEKIEKISVNETTPLEALEVLSLFKKSMNED